MNKILDKIEEFKQKHPDKEIVVVIQTGSHLFDLNTEKSDTDITGIYLPSKNEFKRKVFSKEIPLNTNKSGKPNTKEDVDCKFISIFNFFDLLKMGEFNSIEYLYSPKKSHIVSSPLWEELQSLRDHLFTFNVSSFLGFIRREYGRTGMTKTVKEQLTEFQNHVLLLRTKENQFDKIEKYFPDWFSRFSFLKKVKTIVDNADRTKEINSVFVGQRKFQGTVSLNYLIKELDQILDVRSKQSNRIDSNGKDVKALYHAVRLVIEANYLLDDKKLHIPLKQEDHKYLKEIRRNEHSFESVVEYLDSAIREVQRKEMDFCFKENFFVDKYKNNLFGQLEIKSFLKS